MMMDKRMYLVVIIIFDSIKLNLFLIFIKFVLLYIITLK